MKQIMFIFITGAIGALSMAPFSFPPAIMLGIAVLFNKAQKSKSWRNSASMGFMFSLGYFGFSLYWIGNALLVEGNQYWWAWPLAVSGLPIILSLFTATALSLHFFIKSKTSYALSAIMFIILLFLSELARGYLFTGFPWNLYGYTWINIIQIAQVASLYNIYLLNLFTIFWSVAIATVASCNAKKSTKIIFLSLMILSFAFSYMYGETRIISHNQNQDKNKNNVIVIQPNIPQSEKWDNEKRPDHYLQMLEMSRAQNKSYKDTTLIVWPETAIAQDILSTDWTLKRLKETLQTYQGNVYLLTGALRYENEKYYNSIVVFNKNAQMIQIYDKSHLVPFGEYMPLSNIFDIAPIVGFSGFEKGRPRTKIEIEKALSFTPKICYEIIFPEKQKLTTNYIVNVTNDAWYGTSPGPYQHLVQTQFRAIESNTPIIRAANTGISAIVTPIGTIHARAPLNQQLRIGENNK